MNKPIILGAVAALAVVAAATAAYFVPSLQFWKSPPPIVSQATLEEEGEDESRFPPPPPQSALPTFDVVRISREGRGVIAGRAAPRSRITLHDGGDIIGSATANAGGEWVLIPDEPFSPGTKELSLTAVSPGGDEVESETTVVIAVPGGGGSGDVLAVEMSRDASAPSRVLQRPGAATDQDLGLVAIDYDSVGKINLVGRALAGSEVRIYFDNAYQGDALADSEGGWNLSPEELLAPGLHDLRLDRIGGDGDVAARLEISFRRESGDDLEIGAGQVVVLPGNSLWRIARRLYGRGINYTLIYEANQKRIGDPNLIFPNQVLVVPAVATNGN